MPYLGIDIAQTSFAATLLTSLEQKAFLGDFANTPDGFSLLLETLPSDRSSCVVVMEATGVYAESLCHYFDDLGFPVCVEPPHKVKKAFYERRKTDPVDSRQLAEYGFRFPDQLHFWKPRQEIIDNLRVLVTIRGQYTRMMTSLKNAKKALENKHYAHTTALELHSQMLSEFKASGKLLDKEMKALVQHNLVLNQHVTNLQTIPGVGFWIALNFLLITEGFTEHLNPKQLASYIGICPFQYESGTSIKRRPHADSAGPARLRGLLYLASMTMIRNNEVMHTYFQRKVNAGKPKKVTMNNMANKLLRLMCAIVNNGKPYQQDFSPFNPNLFHF